MFDIGILLKQAGKVVAENSPAILTGIGVTGVVTTAVLAAKGAFKSAGEIVAEEAELALKVESEEITPDEAEMTKKDMFDLTWKNYVPAFITGIATVGVIICAHNIADRRVAAAAAAYTFVEKSFKDYQDKTKEKVGEKKEREIHDEVVEKRFRERDRSRPIIYSSGRGNTNCFDSWSGRQFKSDMQEIQKAINNFNAQVLADDFVSLSVFWSYLGLDPTDQSDNLGWTPDRLLAVKFTCVLEDDEPHLCMTFNPGPKLQYDLD
jgi:hypothetical protein